MVSSLVGVGSIISTTVVIASISRTIILAIISVLLILRTHALQLEITLVRFLPEKVLYPGVKSTQNGPSWSISDY